MDRGGQAVGPGTDHDRGRHRVLRRVARGDRKRGEAGRGGSPPSIRGDRKRGEAGRGGSPPSMTCTG
ncbi:MAG: hypothetical protein EPN51_17025 [Mycobacterium sp.]|nr:MAG: hypothetical protein EPN51_17025 [Mycobacterium sp.]